MTLLADLSDTLSFGMFLILTLSIPVIGLIVSGATLRKRGLNPWCGWSTVMFFVALLAASVIRALGSRGGVGQDIVLYTILGCCGIHVVSALMALHGLSQVRRKKKWAHGRRRGLWMFWLNLGVLFVIGVWCYAHVDETLHYRLLQ
jgi:hypothetical protein